MGYLLTEIVVYLVIAGLIGFGFGWAVRDGMLDKYFDKFLKLIKKVWTAIIGFFEKIKSDFSNNNEKVIKEASEDVKKTVEEVASEKEAKVIKGEIKTQKLKIEEPIQEKEKVKENIPKEVEPEAIGDVSKPTLFTEVPTKGADKLSSIKGIGPVLEKKLNELGVYSFAQIASWDAEQEVWIGTQMSFPKRVTKEEWVKQAKILLKERK